jgi:hypothetical protein
MIITLQLQVKELKRELKHRQKVYPKWVANGYLQRPVADYQIHALEECISTIEGLIEKDKQPEMPTLFDNDTPS